MIDQVRRNSKREGFPKSRLPTFSRTWIKFIRGSADFLGFNYYLSKLVEDLFDGSVGTNASYAQDKNVKESNDPTWMISASGMPSVPQGLHDVLKFVTRTIKRKRNNYKIFLNRWIKKEYNNPSVIITENGWSDKGELKDNGRIKYLYDHLQAILKAIMEDKCNVKGYIGKT